MPFDTGLSLAHPIVGQGSARLKRPRLKLGVFSHGGAWKVYAEFGSPELYATRQEALAAAQARACAEARNGPVEFFIEEEDGALRQVELH